MEIGTRIKKIRKQNGMSLRELAKNSKMSHSYLSQLENGKRDRPAFEIIDNIASALDVSTMYLSSGNEAFEDLSYNESIGEVVDNIEHKAKERYKEGVLFAKDFNFKDFDPVIENLENAVSYQKTIIKDGKELNFYDASFLKDLYRFIRRVNPSEFNPDEQIKLRGIIGLLLSNKRDIDIDDMHKTVTDSNPKNKE